MANIKYINGNPIVATAVELADGSLSGAALTDGSVGGVKIADGSVTDAKIADGSVTSGKIASSSVTTDKLADGSVGNSKLGRSVVDRITAGVSYGNEAVRAFSVNETTNFYKVLKAGRRYVLSTPLANVTTSCSTFTADEYSSGDAGTVVVWNLKSNSDLCIVEASDADRSVHLWLASNVQTDFLLYDITESDRSIDAPMRHAYDVPLYFNNGGVTDSGKISDSAGDKVYLNLLPLRGYYLVTFPDELYSKALMNVEGSATGQKNVEFYHPYSFRYNRGDNGIRMVFGRKDGTALRKVDEVLDHVHVYVIGGGAPQADDVIIAASDSAASDKIKADIVCSGTNDTEILASVFGSDSGVRALLLDGHYYVTSFYTMEDGSHCAMPLVKDGTLVNVRKTRNRVIDVHGGSPCTLQSDNSVKLMVTNECHAMIDSASYYIIGTPYVYGTTVDRFHCNAVFSNFTIIGAGYDKPLTYIDLTSCLSTMIDSVNVKAWNTDGYMAFETTPDPECTALRVGRGSNMGIQNHVKSSHYWYCGKGVACNGEHFIFEDVKAHHDYIGFVFGDRRTVGAFTHPNIMIGCSIEGCHQLMWLSKSGVTEEQDYPQNPPDGVRHSTLDIIALSTETAWFTPTQEGESVREDTLGIHEVIRGCYRGRIDADWHVNEPFFVSGGSGFDVTLYE